MCWCSDYFLYSKRAILRIYLNKYKNQNTLFLILKNFIKFNFENKKNKINIVLLTIFYISKAPFKKQLQTQLF